MPHLKLSSQMILVIAWLLGTPLQAWCADWRPVERMGMVLDFREVDASSIAVKGETIEYSVKYIKHGDAFFTRTIITNCSVGKRAEIINPQDAISPSFSSVWGKTDNGSEVNLVCHLAGQEVHLVDLDGKAWDNWNRDMRKANAERQAQRDQQQPDQSRALASSRGVLTEGDAHQAPVDPTPCLSNQFQCNAACGTGRLAMACVMLCGAQVQACIADASRGVTPSAGNSYAPMAVINNQVNVNITRPAVPLPAKKSIAQQNDENNAAYEARLASQRTSATSLGNTGGLASPIPAQSSTTTISTTTNNISPSAPKVTVPANSSWTYQGDSAVVVDYTRNDHDGSFGVSVTNTGNVQLLCKVSLAGQYSQGSVNPTTQAFNQNDQGYVAPSSSYRFRFHGAGFFKVDSYTPSCSPA
jgi:hypothetical protein